MGANGEPRRLRSVYTVLIRAFEQQRVQDDKAAVTEAFARRQKSKEDANQESSIPAVARRIFAILRYTVPGL